MSNLSSSSKEELQTIQYKNPKPTVDIIIEFNNGIILIEREKTPFGWAIPGGFVEEGESVEIAAIREAKEETNLDVTLIDLLYVYSDPKRDPRQHTISIVFIATACGTLCAGDDAKRAMILTRKNFEQNDTDIELAFDHKQIIEDYYKFKDTDKKPTPKI